MSKTKSEYRYENVWQKVDQPLSSEIVAFWKTESALPADEDPDKRAKQVAVVMRDGDGAIAAISTVAIKRIPRLQQPLYYYRTFCAEKHRGHRTMLDMLSHCQDALRKYNTGLDTPEAIGMLIELESKMLAGRYDEAQNTETGFSFIGQSPRGFNLFVRYFPGFKLQPQAPSKKP
jgi:hypothetical protein